ncbi:23S rRNA (uracil(1939)-C(5))-methyltransferase RlmD [Paenibacillus woosongensis]|uniref:tRNA (Uracil-5-)-methyltransferase n=1 Tax=Paenibacillus woosongensis TaxID=307580 RepID=A0ABQ4MNA7_9BACL|nr:23S rRNA (uracil(1939)-C(5))-methyltransferase RlmD [Paenibacillus woosongensis]GIP57162.1 tRNA (uracil-5-)-methyltransferase [Paenibacillus woosongensis]
MKESSRSHNQHKNNNSAAKSKHTARGSKPAPGAYAKAGASRDGQHQAPRNTKKHEARTGEKTSPRGQQVPLDRQQDIRNARTHKPRQAKPHGSGDAKRQPRDTKSYTPRDAKQQAPRYSGREHAEELRIGDQIVVTIKRLGINGEGVGYYRRKAAFITGALPDEVVHAKVTRVQDKFINADMVKIEKRSPQRADAPCPVFGICGGCQIQHISYPGQLKGKEEIIREAFSRYAGLQELRMKPILGMEHPWGYRNKAQLQLGLQEEGVIAGLYAADSHKLIDITGCPIQHPKVNEAVDKTRNVLQRLGIPVYQEKSNQGIVRTIVVRWGFQSGQLQVTLVAANDRIPRLEQLVKELRLAMPELTSIALNVNPKNTSLVFGNKTTILWGADSIEEALGDLEFTLSPRAFFQLNPLQTVKLYESVRTAAALTGKEVVVDAYCGTGTIGLWLAPYASEVRGIESIPEAVEDAKANAARNGRDNTSFYEGNAEELLPRWVKSGFKADVIIADPPRTGLDPRFIEAVLRTKPKRFVYVSCNPSTLAKDCKELLDGGYSLEWVQPVDMFPQTSHVECTVLLKWAGD